ncbi:MAG: hypothetical protein KIT43_11415 [Bauldia sp.]|nr:hypothetical protein [Bauldia sp.]MCW5716461.1 hypothetical protein [Bauldia sp.]
MAHMSVKWRRNGVIVEKITDAFNFLLDNRGGAGESSPDQAEEALLEWRKEQ